MITYYSNHINQWRFILLVAVLIFCTAHCEDLFAQQPPPRPISVYANPAQGIVFGAFYQGTFGGTVTIYPDGSRSTTGDVIQANLGYSFSPAIIEVDANVGTIITIMNGPDVTLSGSNGGSIKLHVGASSIASPFISKEISPNRTQIRIGGTLTIGSASANPVGIYNGTFSVNFIQQ